MVSDIDSSSDPFCVVEVLGTHKKTRIIHDDISPVWDEVFVYDLIDLYQRYFVRQNARAQISEQQFNKTKDQFLSFFFDTEKSQLSKKVVYEKLRNEVVKNVSLKVSVYDKDNFDNDDFLGSCEVNIDRYGLAHGETACVSMFIVSSCVVLSVISCDSLSVLYCTCSQ